MASGPPTRCTGFTLLELVLVIVLLSILASIAVPVYLNRAAMAEDATLAATVSAVQSTIRSRQAETGSPPATIDASWFRDGRLPSHPDDPDHANPVWVDNVAAATQLHPADKTITAAGAFWYNPASGLFRALVSSSGGPAIVKKYNAINHTSITSAAQTN